jgi:hypothetical protein
VGKEAGESQSKGMLSRLRTVGKVPRLVQATMTNYFAGGAEAGSPAQKNCPWLAKRNLGQQSHLVVFRQ